MHIFNHPKVDPQTEREMRLELKRALPDYELQSGCRIMHKASSLWVAESYPGLKLVALRIKDTRRKSWMDFEKQKEEIRNVLEPLGYKIGDKQFADLELGNRDWDAISLARACERYGTSLSWDIKEALGMIHDTNMQDDWDGFHSPEHKFFSNEYIYLENIIEREGVINAPVRALLQNILAYNPDISTYHFVIYSPNRLRGANSGVPLSQIWIDDFMEIRHFAPFEVIEVPNNDGLDMEVLDDEIRKRNLTPDFAVGLASKVVMNDGSVMHIPMVDLHTGSLGIMLEDRKIIWYEAKASDLLRIVSRYRLHPAIKVKSGNSYHIYGTRLKTPEEWKRFMHELRDDNAVGKIWPDLQIQQGFSLLRITPCAQKPYFPEVEETV